MAYRAPWDHQQALFAKSLLDEGMSYEAVARKMDRTATGIQKAMFRYFGPIRCEGVDRYIVGPAIGPTMECKRIKNDAIYGSQALAEAINAMLAGMAPRTRAECLGRDPQALPGQSPSPFGTASIERLAA